MLCGLADSVVRSLWINRRTERNCDRSFEGSQRCHAAITNAIQARDHLEAEQKGHFVCIPAHETSTFRTARVAARVVMDLAWNLGEEGGSEPVLIHASS